MNNHNKNPDAPVGISLTELIVVLSIIAILISIATLSFHGSVENAQLQHAADRLVSDLRLVRDQARRDQQPYTVQFNSGDRSYYVEGVSGVKGAPDIMVRLAAAPYRISSLIPNVDGESNITFDALGHADPPGNLILQRGSKHITIFISEVGQIEQDQ